MKDLRKPEPLKPYKTELLCPYCKKHISYIFDGLAIYYGYCHDCNRVGVGSYSAMKALKLFIEEKG